MQDSHLMGLVLNKYLKQRRRTKIREEIYFHIDFLTTIIKWEALSFFKSIKKTWLMSLLGS